MLYSELLAGNILINVFSLNTTDCGSLTSIDNGNIAYSSGTTYLSVASFSCNPGYTISSIITRTCMANETWSNDTPHCSINGKFITFNQTIDILILLQQYTST